jgi:hypothetical protein
MLTPGSTRWGYDYLQIEPHARRNVALPAVLEIPGVPGTAPAKADIVVTHSGGAAAPAWALAAWAKKPIAAVDSGVAPFGIIEAETAGDLAGWAVSASGAYRGGSLLSRTVAGAEALTASWIIDPNTLEADEFTDGELDLELYAVIGLASGLVTPKLTASVRPLDGLDYGSERFTREWGSSGKLLVKPSSSSAKRLVRLGTIPLPVDAAQPRALKLWLTGSTAAGSAGVFTLDYLLPVLARARALGPTGKPLDSRYPKFISATAEITKRIRHDLVGEIAKPPNYPTRDHGLGGNLIELPPGDVRMLLKLSNLVPDDPTSDTTGEQLAHNATVRVDVTPRSWLLRT